MLLNHFYPPQRPRSPFPEHHINFVQQNQLLSTGCRFHITKMCLAMAVNKGGRGERGGSYRPMPVKKRRKSFTDGPEVVFWVILYYTYCTEVVSIMATSTPAEAITLAGLANILKKIRIVFQKVKTNTRIITCLKLSWPIWTPVLLYALRRETAVI